MWWTRCCSGSVTDLSLFLWTRKCCHYFWSAFFSSFYIRDGSATFSTGNWVQAIGLDFTIITLSLYSFSSSSHDLSRPYVVTFGPFIFVGIASYLLARHPQDHELRSKCSVLYQGLVLGLLCFCIVPSLLFDILVVRPKNEERFLVPLTSLQLFSVFFLSSNKWCCILLTWMFRFQRFSFVSYLSSMHFFLFLISCPGRLPIGDFLLKLAKYGFYVLLLFLTVLCVF